MQKYKIICINLERRTDRKQNMIKLFDMHNITNYNFFNAIDGLNIDINNPQLSFFKHDMNVVKRRGVVGCALSHYNVWNNLLNDKEHECYVIVEDDIRLVPNFKRHLENYINKMTQLTQFIFLGIHVTRENSVISKNIYRDDNSYDIFPLSRHFFTGGLFGYIITKVGAKQLVDYILLNGIKRAIDYVVFDSNIPLYETRPQIIFSDSVQDSDHYVDSDIQRDLVAIDLRENLVSNNYLFDDYDFYPNLDSFGYDIMQAYCDIEKLKQIADRTDDCVAFNTYGWIKYDVESKYKFIYLKNNFYSPDGLYVKKNYKRNTTASKKFRDLKIVSKDRPIKIFIGSCASTFSTTTVNMILNKFSNYEIVSSSDEEHDVLINHCCDRHHYFNNNRLNIIISGEPWNIQREYDLCIDTKHKSPVKNTIYYPFLFSSLREHRKSINPKDYPNSKTKFCAFMYSVSYPHRIKYFDLISSYKSVDALGRCCKNVDIEDTRDKNDRESTFNDIAVELYSNYKFVIAVENTFLGGYTTEKLINPLIANSIPIYWGDGDIFKYINKKRVVYIPDFSSDQELLEHIKFLDINDEAYEAIVNEDIYTDPNFTLEKIESELDDQIGKILTV